MEPERFTGHNDTPEMPLSAGEYPSVNGASSPESAPASPESSKERPTTPPAASVSNSAAPLLNPLQPSATDDSSQTAVDQSDNDAARATGSLEDLKRWYIDKAEKAISNNKNDPYLESQQIEQIKRDYLKDIYHREIKLTPE